MSKRPEIARQKATIKALATLPGMPKLYRVTLRGLIRTYPSVNACIRWAYANGAIEVTIDHSKPVNYYHESVIGLPH